MEDKMLKALKEQQQKSGTQAKFAENQQLLNTRNEERLQKLEAETFAGVWAAYLELKQQTDTLTSKIKLLENTKTSASSVKTKDHSKTAPSDELQEIKNDTVKKRFFPVPDNKTGQFRDVLGKDEISGYTVYEFVIDKADNKKAHFKLIKTAQVEAAVLSFPELYLLHACETDGTPGITKKIETVTPGLAVLTEDYWTVQKKALIRYV